MNVLPVVRTTRSQSTEADPRVVSGREGFTILEILVAIVVLTVGLLGVLALFPVSYQRINTAAAESQASAIAESFHAGLVVALANSRTPQNANRWATLKHAAVHNHEGSADDSDTNMETYHFPLPNTLTEEEEGNTLVSYEFPYPTDDPGSPFGEATAPPDFPGWGGAGTGNHDQVGRLDSEQSTQADYIWQFGQGGDGSGLPETDMDRLIENVKEFDGTFGLDQYSVAIEVQAIAEDPLYRVLIRVYRNYLGRSDFAPGEESDLVHPDLVEEYRAMISADS